MNETSWLTADDLMPLLRELRGRISERKRRLFVCTCVRSIWHLLPDERSRQAVEAAERYADGLIREKELEQAWREASPVRRSIARAVWTWTAASAAQDAAQLVGYAAAVPKAALAVSLESGRGWVEDPAERRRQCALLHDVFGNPFRPVRVDPAWLAWNEGCVGRLARAIYRERRFDELPVLADALEEAGCAGEAILDHCRGPGPHTRGCWLLDRLLGKE